MNAATRSISRPMIVVAAPLGGLLADRIGYRTALWTAAAGFAIAAVALGMSRFAGARIQNPAAS